MLIGGGFWDSEAAQFIVDSVSAVICADSGGSAAIDAGITPDMIIGDMDSFTGQFDGTVIHLSEQDSTDFEKCLYSVKAPFYIGYGFLGGRLDHELAALSILTRYPEKTVVLIGEKDICFRCPDEITMNIEKGARFSVFPMGDVEMKSTGLEWPLDGLKMSPKTQIATSNRVSDDQVTLSVDKGDSIVMVPLAYMDAVIAALTS
ncbi:thiamine diphosphokinase [Amylibacter sp. SFDW26]|uniref:thiamine diphosphokinase n=1 Tax=Amylibacter sp. SFDW26 TaxID=2652722 RepID=UPI00186A0595|nr:thiamine diphosphokinase [Amylibacter sp. SFDW26]